MNTSTMAVLSLILVAAMAFAGVWAWAAAPGITQIAVHWNFAGEAVAYREKELVLAVPPAAAALLSIVLGLMAASDPGSRVAKRARAVWLAGLAALALVHVFFVLAAAGLVTTFGNYTALAPALFLGIVGNYMAKGAESSGKRWMGRLLVVMCLATFATWILVPGVAAELVFIAGLLISLLPLAFAPSGVLQDDA